MAHKFRGAGVNFSSAHKEICDPCKRTNDWPKMSVPMPILRGAVALTTKISLQGVTYRWSLSSEQMMWTTGVMHFSAITNKRDAACKEKRYISRTDVQL